MPVVLTTDPLDEPASVIFYREVAGLPAVVLGTVTSVPFTTTWTSPTSRPAPP